MKVLLLALLGVFVLADAGSLARAQRADDEKQTWQLSAEGREHMLGYGTDNPEDTPI